MLSRAFEGYPAENSLTLTGAFISARHNIEKKVQMKGVDDNTDLTWLYVLVVVLIVGTVIMGIICMCTDKEPKKKKKEAETEGEDKKEKKKSGAKE